MPQLVMVCRPAKVLIFYSGHPDICTAMHNNNFISKRHACHSELITFNNYSTILTEPEVNNCFSIFTRSDLNRIKKETIKKTIRLIDG